MKTYSEFDARELQSLGEENIGTPYRRAARISDRAMKARIEAALKETQRS